MGRGTARAAGGGGVWRLPLHHRLRRRSPSPSCCAGQGGTRLRSPLTPITAAAMPLNPTREKDPLDWTAIIAVFFLALVWYRLGIPTRIYFDEVHYVLAARKLLALHTNNPEHPMLGKEIIAAAIALLGDKSLYWRLP